MMTPPVSPTSASEQLRMQGTEHLKRARVPGLAPVLRTRRLQDALNHYVKAATAATTAAEVASARKNAMITNADMVLDSDARVREEALNPRDLVQAVETLRFRFTEMCGEGNEALTVGKTADPRQPHSGEAWQCATLGILLRTVTTLCQRHPYESWRDCARRIESWALTSTATLRRGNLPDIKLHMCLRLFDAHKAGMVEALEGNDVKTAQYHAAEMPRPLLEAERCLKHTMCRMDRAHLIDPKGTGGTNLELTVSELCEGSMEVKVRHGDMQLEQARVAAAAHILAGDRTLTSATNDFETLVVELIWVALDEYRAAALQARDIDIESEGKALSRIGRCFAQYMKMTQRAAKYYRLALELAATLHPRDMRGEPWYDEAVAGVDAAERVQRHNDNAAQSARDAAIKATLIVELAALSAEAEKSTNALLTHIYDKHPPKKEVNRRVTTTEDGEDVSIKTQLRKALTHYHPDTVARDGGNEKWRVLCQEIYKLISAQYNSMK